MTEEQLVDLRLERLEKQAEGARSTERDVDRLKIEMPRLEQAVGEFRSEATIRHEQLHASLVRLHQRFDDMVKDDYREQGARDERARLGKWLVTAVVASSGLAAAIVAVVQAVVGQHP